MWLLLYFDVVEQQRPEPFPRHQLLASGKPSCHQSLYRSRLNAKQASVCLAECLKTGINVTKPFVLSLWDPVYGSFVVHADGNSRSAHGKAGTD